MASIDGTTAVDAAGEGARLLKPRLDMPIRVQTRPRCLPSREYLAWPRGYRARLGGETAADVVKSACIYERYKTCKKNLSYQCDA